MQTVTHRSAAAGAAPETIPIDPEPRSAGGVLDFYRAILTSVTSTQRRRLAILAEVILVLAYFLLRTAGGESDAMRDWLIIATVVAIASPTTGLVVLAAIAPFNEGLSITRDVGSKSALALSLLLAVAVRVIAARQWRGRPPAPVVLAAALFLASGAGLLLTWARWGRDYGQQAAQFWLYAIGTMLVVFVVTVWVARRGELRPLVVVLTATTIAGIVSLIDFGGDAAIRTTPLGWVVAGPFNRERLTGVIRSPTSTAALVMLPASVFIVGATLARGWRLRIGLAVLTIPLLVAAYLTYNRAVFLVLFAVAVVIGWRVRRAVGIAILVAGLIVGAIALPSYVALRGSVVGSAGQAEPGQVLIASDQQRLTAWGAASRMFLDRPLTGQGYRAYRQISVAFGDPTLNAPHNEWLRFFAEGGIVTGLVGVAFAVTTGIALLRRRGWLETGLFCAFASLCFAASFNNPFLFDQVTIPAFILAGTGVALAVRPSVEPDGR
jgi:O-antigen ligase